MAESEWIIETDDGGFETAVLARSKTTPVLVDFWAEWCQPCLMLGPVLEKLAIEMAGQFLLAKVNVDHSPYLAQQFGVSSIPMVVGISDGQVTGHFVGVQNEAAIRSFIARIGPSEGDKLVRQAVPLEETDPAAAEKLYAQAVDLEPRNTRAKAARADMLVRIGKIDDARQVAGQIGMADDGYDRAKNVLARLEFHDAAAQAGGVAECQRRVQGNPGDLQARLDLGLAQAAAGDFPASLETLVSLVETDRAFGTAHAKAVVVKIFAIVGPQSELANRYRSRLASALY